ncbi:Hypothetical predicted protein [Mytilus galloprovincialis]|uniref:B box-type domain-containing protein n=1 Tax=Mytilus galloprovincialis TaxID=29158 RepID=A0A8B6BL87_MYTGA|nr:Hypothetical predicted protein [Mytilus galloprovincialis]
MAKTWNGSVKRHGEVPCVVVCVPSKHKACSGVLSISANSANSRQSTALSTLEEMIEGTLRNVQQCINNRETATKETNKNWRSNHGCVILPNGHLLLANYESENALIKYSETGEHVRDILVTTAPYDIDLIDVDRIVVTYGDALFMEIINNNTFDVEKKISLQKGCLGVSHGDGKLYVAYGNDILVIGLSGNIIETLKVQSENAVYIKTSRNRLFYSNDDACIVYYCNLNGDEMWQFKSDSIENPSGVLVDNDNNVFVVGYISNNLTIIQHDGTDSKTLLTESDGLDCPEVLMASGKHIPCGPCGFDDVIKDAWRRCTKCEEGLCDDCEKA